MTKLFIIGNGFDRAHDLPTSYADYRFFLENNSRYKEFLRKLENAYGLNGNNDLWWRDFESNLGDGSYFEADFDGMAQSVIENMTDDEGDPMPDIESALTVHFTPYYEFMNELNDTVLEWARSIELKSATKIAKKITNRNSFYLTFNYTDVLENVYEIEEWRVFHVHGSASGQEVIMGHGNVEVIERYKNELEEAEEHLYKNEAVIASAIKDFFEASLKDTSSIIDFNRFEFSKYRDVNKVYVIGHSLGCVDWPYFEEVKKIILADAKWYFYIYDMSKDKAQVEKLLDFLDIDSSRVEVLKSDLFFNK